MPTIRDSRSIAAGVTELNILAGSKFEFMPQAAAILVYAAHNGGGPVAMDVTFGNVIEGDNMIIPEVATATDGPNINDHLLASGVAAPGDRLQIKIQNRHATVAAVVRTLVQIRPL